MYCRILQRNDRASELGTENKSKRAERIVYYTHLSRLDAEITFIPFPGLDVYHDPKSPSFPAAIVTILPVLAMREDSTEVVLSVQPSAPPKDKVRMSMPSEKPRKRASTSTSSVTSPEQPKTRYALMLAAYATPEMLNSLPGLAPMIPATWVP